jgi:hypothetical protein
VTCKDEHSCAEFEFECGNYYPFKDGGTFYICNPGDIKTYRGSSDPIKTLVFVGTIDCASADCTLIPVSNTLKTIAGIDDAVITGGSWSQPFLEYSDDNNVNLEAIKDLTFSNITTSATALIAETTKPLSLTNITLDTITLTSTSNKRPSYIGVLFGQIRSDSDNILNLKDSTFRNISVTHNSPHYYPSSNMTPRCGGLVGYIESNAGLNISDVTIDGLTVVGQSTTGGLVGYVEGALNISSSEIKSSSVTSQNVSAGGIIGVSAANSTTTIRHTKNLFSQINTTHNASSNGAGGIAGILQGSVTIEDVINRCNSKDCVIANYNAAGGIGVLTKASRLSVNNVINEIKSVSATSGYAAGFISEITSPSGPINITNVISRLESVSGNNYVSGFIRYADLNNINTKLANILCSSTVETAATSEIKSAGFIQDLQNFNGLKINNILSDSQAPAVSQSFSGSALFNVISDVAEYNSDCPVTGDNYTDYGNFSHAESTIVIFDSFIPKVEKLFYVMPGWLGDKYLTTLNALTACGEEFNGGKNAEEQCVFHRDYRTPVLNCWFTDYIYHPGLKTVDELLPEDIPFKPYHPYAVDFVQIGGSNYEIDETTKQTGDDYSNAAAVLEALNTVEDAAQSVTLWDRCKSLSDASDKLTLNGGAYEDLLCPVLSDTLTCLKASCP